LTRAFKRAYPYACTFRWIDYLLVFSGECRILWYVFCRAYTLQICSMFLQCSRQTSHWTPVASNGWESWCFLMAFFLLQKRQLVWVHERTVPPSICLLYRSYAPIFPFYVAFMVLVFTALMAVIYTGLFIAAWIRFHCSFMIEAADRSYFCSLINSNLDLCVFF